MRVLVCGGRAYGNGSRVNDTLFSIAAVEGIDVIIHGGAKGADTLAGEWARGHGGITCIVEYPDWNRYGPGAGSLRNTKMLTHKPDIVVAFPGGRGTSDMMRQARAAGIRVMEVV